MPGTFRYKAFVSYSHDDEHWAKWLHRALESYRPPKSLDTRARLKPIFRDRDELSASRDLSTEIQAALADAENLIVVCSPSAARSRWVNEEIRHFASLGRGTAPFACSSTANPMTRSRNACPKRCAATRTSNRSAPMCGPGPTARPAPS